MTYVKMKVNLPMVVLIDNIGAIEMLDSKTGQCKTKHIDTIPDTTGLKNTWTTIQLK